MGPQWVDHRDMTQTPTTRRRRPFFETTLGGFVIAGAILAAVAILIYITQYANPSYEERRGDAELECIEHLTLQDSSEFDACVEYEMR